MTRDERLALIRGKRCGSGAAYKAPGLFLASNPEAASAVKPNARLAPTGGHWRCRGLRMKGRTVAVWGLAFKPRTDDMREAPSVPLIDALLGASAKVQAFDPEAAKTARDIFGPKVTFAATNYDALKGADCLAIVTEWNEFRRPDFARMRSLMRAPVVFDGRNLFEPGQMKQNGFTYYSIGRS